MSNVIETILFVAGGMLTSSLLGLPLALLYVLVFAFAKEFFRARKAFLFCGSVLFGLVGGLVWYSWWHRSGFSSFAGFDYYTPPLARPAWIASGVAGVLSGLVLRRFGSAVAVAGLGDQYDAEWPPRKGRMP